MECFSSTPYTKSFLCLYSNKSKKEIYLWKSQHYKHCVSKKYQSGILIDDLVFLKLIFSAICFVYENFYLPVLPDKLLLCHRATLPWQFSKKKSKLFWKTAGVTQLFSKVHLKKCYCDARYLGKSVGDPLKIVQNESVTKKNTYWSTLCKYLQFWVGKSTIVVHRTSYFKISTLLVIYTFFIVSFENTQNMSIFTSVIINFCPKIT